MHFMLTLKTLTLLNALPYSQISLCIYLNMFYVYNRVVWKGQFFSFSIHSQIYVYVYVL